MTRRSLIDPRTKLWIVMCMSSLSVFIKDIYLLGLIFIMCLAVSIILKSPLLIVVKRVKKFLYIFIGMVVIQSIFTDTGKSLLVIWEITILTDVGMIKAVLFIFRITIVLISASILMTSSSRTLLQGLIQLRIPYEIVFMVMIGMKFIPLLSEELKDNLTAIELRGIPIKKLPLKKKIQLYTYIFTPVIIGAILRSKQMAIAMECKGFRAYDHRTSLIELHLRWKDYIIMGSSLVMSIIIVGCYYWV